MSRGLTRTARGAFAALMAAGFTFGAGSVLASPRDVTACPVNPDAGQYGYVCSTVVDCNLQCPFRFGNICSQGCCVCST